MREKRHTATELQSLEEVLKELPLRKMWAKSLLSRVTRISNLPPNAKILDVGAGSGGFLAACHELGYEGVGVEPSEEARFNAIKLADHLGARIHIAAGKAECIPYSDNSFHVVHAANVLEHVLDVEKTISEIYRVLRPEGAFWFNSASAMCPWQDEIRGFPLFGWYPLFLKLKIMRWVKETRPDLVGFTATPAINWFTPSKARALLKRHGFKLVYDRWDLREKVESRRFHKVALRMIGATKISKSLADVIVSGCSYAAIK